MARAIKIIGHFLVLGYVVSIVFQAFTMFACIDLSIEIFSLPCSNQTNSVTSPSNAPETEYQCGRPFHPNGHHPHYRFVYHHHHHHQQQDHHQDRQNHSNEYHRYRNGKEYVDEIENKNVDFQNGRRPQYPSANQIDGIKEYQFEKKVDLNLNKQHQQYPSVSNHNTPSHADITRASTLPTDDDITRASTLPTHDDITRASTLPTHDDITRALTLPTDDVITRASTLSYHNGVTRASTLPTDDDIARASTLSNHNGVTRASNLPTDDDITRALTLPTDDDIKLASTFSTLGDVTRATTLFPKYDVVSMASTVPTPDDITRTSTHSTPDITRTSTHSTPDITRTSTHSTPDITRTSTHSTPDITRTSTHSTLEEVTRGTTLPTHDEITRTSTLSTHDDAIDDVKRNISDVNEFENNTANTTTYYHAIEKREVSAADYKSNPNISDSNDIGHGESIILGNHDDNNNINTVQLTANHSSTYDVDSEPEDKEIRNHDNEIGSHNREIGSNDNEIGSHNNETGSHDTETRTVRNGINTHINRDNERLDNDNNNNRDNDDENKTDINNNDEDDLRVEGSFILDVINANDNRQETRLKYRCRVFLCVHSPNTERSDKHDLHRQHYSELNKNSTIKKKNKDRVGLDAIEQDSSLNEYLNGDHSKGKVEDKNNREGVEIVVKNQKVNEANKGNVRIGSYSIVSNTTGIYNDIITPPTSDTSNTDSTESHPRTTFPKKNTTKTNNVATVYFTFIVESTRVNAVCRIKKEIQLHENETLNNNHQTTIGEKHDNNIDGNTLNTISNSTITTTTTSESNKSFVRKEASLQEDNIIVSNNSVKEQTGQQQSMFDLSGDGDDEKRSNNNTPTASTLMATSLNLNQDVTWNRNDNNNNISNDAFDKSDNELATERGAIRNHNINISNDAFDKSDNELATESGAIRNDNINISNDAFDKSYDELATESGAILGSTPNTSGLVKQRDPDVKVNANNVIDITTAINSTKTDDAYNEKTSMNQEIFEKRASGVTRNSVDFEDGGRLGEGGNGGRRQSRMVSSGSRGNIGVKNTKKSPLMEIFHVILDMGYEDGVTDSMVAIMTSLLAGNEDDFDVLEDDDDEGKKNNDDDGGGDKWWKELWTRLDDNDHDDDGDDDDDDDDDGDKGRDQKNGTKLKIFDDVDDDENDDDCNSMEFFYSKLAIYIQVFGVVSSGFCAHSVYKNTVKGRRLPGYLSVATIAATIFGILSMVTWSAASHNLSEYHWTFWPYIACFFYILLAAIAVLAHQFCVDLRAEEEDDLSGSGVNNSGTPHNVEVGRRLASNDETSSTLLPPLGATNEKASAEEKTPLLNQSPARQPMNSPDNAPPGPTALTSTLVTMDPSPPPPPPPPAAAAETDETIHISVSPSLEAAMYDVTLPTGNDFTGRGNDVMNDHDVTMNGNNDTSIDVEDVD